MEFIVIQKPITQTTTECLNMTETNMKSNHCAQYCYRCNRATSIEGVSWKCISPPLQKKTNTEQHNNAMKERFFSLSSVKAAQL